MNGEDRQYFANAIRNVDRYTYAVDRRREQAPPPDLDPVVYAQLANAWAAVALARAIAMLAESTGR